MMNSLLRVVLIFLVLFLLILGGTFLLPSSIHIENSIAIESPPCTVFTLLNGFVSFNRFSPWFEMDPEARFSFTGPTFGPGARISWESQGTELENGSSELRESKAFELIKIHHVFDKSGEAESTFKLGKEGEGSRVTWTFVRDLGRNPFARIQALRMKKEQEARFAAALKKLKEWAESLPKDDWSSLPLRVTQLEPTPILTAHGACPPQPAAIGKALGGAFGKVAEFMSKNGIEQAGAPLSISRKWDPSGYEFDAGFPYKGTVSAKAAEKHGLHIGTTPKIRVIQGEHIGPASKITGTYTKIAAFMVAHGFTPAGDPWESYVSDPSTTPRDKLLTLISYPVNDPVFQ